MTITKIAGGSLAAAVAVAGLTFAGGTAAQAAPGAQDSLPTCTKFTGSGSHKITDVDGNGKASAGDKITLTVVLKNGTKSNVPFKAFSAPYTDANGGAAYYSLTTKQDTLKAGGTVTLTGTHTIKEGDFGKTNPVTLVGPEFVYSENGVPSCNVKLANVTFQGDDLGGDKPAPKPEPKPEPKPKPEPEPGPPVDTGYMGEDNTATAGLAGAGLLLAGAATVGATRLRRNN